MKLLLDVLRYIVSQGISVHAKNCVGNTPLYFAARINSVEALRILVSQGANVNAKCEHWEWKGWTPLHGAANHNPDINVLIYLISQGADVDAKTFGFFGVFGKTPFDVANTKEKKRVLREAMKK